MSRLRGRDRRLAIASCSALALASALGAAACSSVGKGNYGWVNEQVSLGRDSGQGALRVSWMAELTPAKRGAYRPIENAIPAVDVEHARIYVGAESGRLHAFGFDGRPLYRFEFDEPIECEPALDGAADELYVGNERGELFALTPSSGKMRWKIEATGAIRQRPLLLGDAVYVITEEDVVEAFSRADGAVLWRYERERSEGFLMAGHAGLTLLDGSRILAAFNDGAVVSLDALDGKLKWERPTSIDVPETDPGRPRYTDIDTTPVAMGDFVYVASFGAGLYCLDKHNGSVVWREAEWTGISAMGATEDGALLVVSADRGVARFEPSTRSARWIKTLERGSFGVPEIYEGLAVLGDSRGSLVALDLATGDEVGRIESGHGFVARAAVASGRGFIVTNGGVLLAMRVRH